MEKVVEFKNISLSYNTLESEIDALKFVNFYVKEGEFVSIVGPSGCGKSTLLSLAAGLIIPSDGGVYINKSLVDAPTKNVGYMLQKDHLFEWRNIYKNIIIGLEVQNKLNDKNIQFVYNLIEQYGLKDFIEVYPRQLSGGMRQRVALIRTLATSPKVLLLDESFSALDYQTRLTIVDEIWKIIKEQNKTTLLVTHDIAEAVSVSDRVVVLSKRPGCVKNIFEMHFTNEYNTPMKRRQSPDFYAYYNKVWKELDISV